LILELRPDLKASEALINEWEAQNKSELERSRQLVADLHSAGRVDLSMLSVALRELENLAH
jgi:NAD-specific glutamate dehydrogenase